MRILVTGVSGMLGSSLAVELSQKHKVFGTGNSVMSLPIDYRIFDLSNESYKELIDWSQPELIIHCAALTNGNYCQNNPLEAFNVNGCATKKLMDASEDHVKIMYVSTDAVFSSSLHMAKEIDCSSPENVYGKSKELGEFFLLNSNRDYLILRTTIVGLNAYRDKEGFVEWGAYKPFTLKCAGSTLLRSADETFSNILDAICAKEEPVKPCFVFAEADTNDANIRLAIIEPSIEHQFFGCKKREVEGFGLGDLGSLSE